MSRAAFPLAAAAALFIERQHLDRPRGRRLTAASLARFAEDTGGIQMDSINAVERAHYLTAWARFGTYDRAAFDRLVYGRRVLFEYFAHVACLVPASHLTQRRWVMEHYARGHRAWAAWARPRGKLLREVEDAIRERGPLANADFTDPRRGRASGWWNWKPAAFALHYLWATGRIAVHSRVHFQKRYDLIGRVLPEAAGSPPPADGEYHRWHVRRSLHAMGAATEADLRMYLTTPALPRAERLRTLEAMRRAGEIVEVAIEGEDSPWLALAEDLPALESAARRRKPPRGTALLAPFDSLLWHRERAKRLFGFDYRIETYTPGHRRVHGYYVMPIYHDGQLIGRVDARTRRAERRLEVHRVQLEPWLVRGAAPPAASWGVVDVDAALDGLAEALASLAAFVGADDVALAKVVPGRLRAPLARALRAATIPAHGSTSAAPGATRENCETTV
jgi:uncharacterized protein YcaQ